MSRWGDIATWVGPTPNVSGPMVEQRGMILHVMQGSLAGSIAWGKNPASRVSFHFGTSHAGACQQLVDTDVTAWTQGNGNGRWISVENEDYSGNALTDLQVEKVAALYARGVKEYGWAYQLADTPSGFGLGWHGMGGAAWGGHPDCPGQPIIDQRPAILDLARKINNGGPTGGDDVQTWVYDTDGRKWLSSDNGTRQLADERLEADVKFWYPKAGRALPTTAMNEAGTAPQKFAPADLDRLWGVDIRTLQNGGAAGGVSESQARTIAREEIGRARVSPGA